MSRDIHCYVMKLEDLSQISKYIGRKGIRHSSNHSLQPLKSRYTYTNDITQGLMSPVISAFQVMQIERNRRIFYNIPGLFIKSLRSNFWTALWASVTAEFRHYSLSALDWKPVVCYLLVCPLPLCVVLVLSFSVFKTSCTQILWVIA